MTRFFQPFRRTAAPGPKEHRQFQPSKQRILPVFTRFLAVFALALAFASPTNAFEPTKNYTKMNINGWTVYVSSELEKSPKERQVILSKIQAQTARIARTVSKKHLRILRKSDIWVEGKNHYRSLARYHGYKGEIYQENLNPQKYRDIEVFGQFARTKQPSLMLHELAHVYHDRKLSWSSARISRLYDRFKVQSAKAVDRCRRTTRAYALENEHEFFAVFTEAYFGKTCSYPYNRETIQKRHPEMHALLAKIWGR